jgi:hypothetical protein
MTPTIFSVLLLRSFLLHTKMCILWRASRPNQKDYLIQRSVQNFGCARGRVHVCACGCTGAGVCMRTCSLTNPRCNAPPHYHLRPLWLHHISPHYLIHCTIFGKKLLNIIFVFWFLLQLLLKTLLIVRIIQRDITINVKTSSCKVPVILVGF